MRRENITVPAGTFDCFVIEANGTGVTEHGAKVELRSTRWMAPDKVRRPIVIEQYRKVSVQLGAGKSGGFGGKAGPGMSDGQGGFGGKGAPGMSGGAGGFAGRFPGKGGFAGKGGMRGPGGAGGGAGRTIEKLLDSERQELVAYRQS